MEIRTTHQAVHSKIFLVGSRDDLEESSFCHRCGFNKQLQLFIEDLPCGNNLASPPICRILVSTKINHARTGSNLLSHVGVIFPSLFLPLCSLIRFQSFHLFQIFVLLVSSLIFEFSSSANASEVFFFEVFVLVFFILICLLVAGGSVTFVARLVLKDAAVGFMNAVKTREATGSVFVSPEFKSQLPDMQMTVNPRFSRNNEFESHKTQQ
eukprot:TRINITY_DN5427_c0_g5_i1.p1 TRINITY_DN5427_c0_g5~~TRINITY_DN5427_c0_g5_i1.p1  ORF type:complete len:210 (+),score=40.03 TRINITY_DN5427_c0_g5_i1:131-760(+)